MCNMINKIKPVILFILLLTLWCPVHGSELLNSWEYCWRSDDSVPSYLSQLDWTPIAKPYWTDYSSNYTLWLRIKLPEKQMRDPSVFVEHVYRDMTVYCNDRILYHYGEKSRNSKTDYSNGTWHLVLLDADSPGRYLYFKINSFDRQIGLPGKFYYGSELELHNLIFKRELTGIIIVSFFIITGLISLFLFFSRLRERFFLTFGLFCLAVGIWNVSILQAKQFLFFAPNIWMYAEYLSLYVSPVFIALFFDRLFGTGRWSFLKVIAIIHGVFLLFATGVLLYDPYYLRSITLKPFQVMITITVTSMLIYIIRKAIRGNIEAKILLPGIVAFFITGLIDIFCSMMSLGYRFQKISYWGMLAFILTIAIMLQRYLIRWKERAGTLPKKVASTNGDAVELTEYARHKMEEAKIYIAENFMKDINREEIAQAVGLHPDYLGKMFRLYTGIKITDYINKLKINKAIELLNNSNDSIVNVSLDVGFESLSTFYRAFQKTTGVSPNKFRRDSERE